jgi:hypothetical protein
MADDNSKRNWTTMEWIAYLLNSFLISFTIVAIIALICYAVILVHRPDIKLNELLDKEVLSNPSVTQTIYVR